MKENKSYTLTKAEIQIMNILWEMPEGGCVHDIIARYDEPKPAYTTIATFMKILQNKKRGHGKLDNICRGRFALPGTNLSAFLGIAEERDFLPI